jgi:hypothetical protein
MSKRAKFALITWIGASVSALKKAKCSTDKAFLKEACPVRQTAHHASNHAHICRIAWKLKQIFPFGCPGLFAKASCVVFTMRRTKPQVKFR